MSGPQRGTSPPQLDNFDFRSLLGSGGYADVYLYEQQRPRREVAVKVLLAEGLTEAGRRQFAAEADLMAALSAHPAIVTIYGADISADGRPYLVMEYYPGSNLRARSRTERMPVAEVLRIGVQVCSAVETAHRAGIVHRDIKPANILTSRYNKPGLTDFGISASTHDAGRRRSRGDVRPVGAAGGIRVAVGAGCAIGRLLARRDALHAAGRSIAVRATGGVEHPARPHGAHRA